MNVQAYDIAKLKEAQGNRLDSTSDFWMQAEQLQKELLQQGKKACYIFLDLENFRFINMQGDISEGAHLLTEVSALIHQTFPDALITRGASIQFAVVTGVPDVRERLIHLHKKALSLRSNNQLDLKAGIFIVSNPQISPITASDYAKAACAHIKKDYQAGKLSLLETNAAFTAREGQLAFRDSAAFNEYMGQAGTFYRRNLLQAIKQCQDTQMGITIEVLSHNEVCTLRIDPIAQNESNGAEAFLIILTGVRTSAFKDRKAAVQSIMNGIFSLFDSFFALNLTTQTVHRIKVGMSVIDEIERLPLPLFLREWARRHVFSEDWKRFLQFYDLATLVTRINESGCGYLSTFFRVTSSEQENRNGWQLHLVWLSGEPSDVKVYCGTVNLRHFMGVQMPRPMEPILARNKLVPSPQLDKMDAILPEVLWEAMLHLPEMNVYWKDVRGRFLGANDAFLHYFNLSSLDDILGQSEEELGWNVEFDPTYREEEMLLGQIPVISEEKVHCMAKGMIRTVMMNKIPLIEGGRIVGSLSWFRDVTRFTQIQAELKKKSVIDALTGALNYQGFKETQSHFVDNYQKWDLDFILIYMDLDDFKHCNDAYGHGFGDMVLQEGVKRLQKIFNHYGVVARVGGDEFIALLPIVGSEDIRRIKQEIQQSLKAPLSIDGRSYLGGISVGIARYSETEDMDALQELADQRMYEDKKKRKKMKDLTYGYLVTTEGN